MHPVEPQVLEGEADNGPGGLRTVSLPPVGLADPVAKLCPAMFRVDLQADCPDQEPAWAEGDGEGGPLPARQALLMGADPFFGHPIHIGVWDAERVAGNVPLAGEALNVGSVSQAETAKDEAQCGKDGLFDHGCSRLS